MLMDPRLYVKRGDAPEIDVASEIQGLRFLGDDVNPNPVTLYEQNTGVDGQNPLTTTFDKNIVTANFVLKFGDWYDFKLVKHEIYRLFNFRKSMRIRTDAEPAIIKYVKPVPFEVKPAEDTARYSSFSIPFENPSGYKYSIGRSDELDTDTFRQIGMNLPNQAVTYHFTTTSFAVYNASDIAVDPYFEKHDLKITSHFSGDSMTLTNKTNGSTWTYSVAATKSDTIILDGIACTLNGKPASMNTDCSNLVLETGWNTIEVTGATDVDITFSFPFIYLG